MICQCSSIPENGGCLLAIDWSSFQQCPAGGHQLVKYCICFLCFAQQEDNMILMICPCSYFLKRVAAS